MSSIEGVSQRELKEDLARIHRSFEHSQARAKLGSWEIDLATGEGWWSKQMYVLFGFDPNRSPPSLDQFLELIHPDDRQSIIGNQRLLAQSGQTRTIHYRSNPDPGPLRFFVEIVECVNRNERVILAGTTQDVTVHKAAEQKIRGFELAVENAMQGISRLNRDGHFVIVKPEYARMLGYEPGELVGEPWEITVPAEDHQVAIQGYRQMLCEGRAEVECRAVRKDGSIFVKHLLLVKTYDQQGRHEGHYCFMRDITERRNAEESLIADRQELAKQLAEVELLYRNAPVGLCLMDTEMRYVRINERLASINGRSVEDHIGRRLHDVVPDIADQVERICRRVIDSCEPAINLDVERIVSNETGETRNYLVNFHPLKESSGNVVGVSAVVQDITQRRRSAEELAIRQEAIANSVTPTAFGDADFRLQYVNQAFLDLFGFDSADEVLGMPNTMFASSPVSIAQINDAMLQTKCWSGEVVTRRKDGTSVDVVLHASLIRDQAGRPLNSIVTFWDVTERKRAAARLAAQTRQQAAVAQLGLAALQGTTIDQLMQTAVELLAEILDVEYSKILELNAAQSELALRWGVGWRGGLIGRATVPTQEDSQAGYTLGCKEPVVVESLPDETRFRGPDLLLDHDVISGISVVIHGAARPFGVVAVHTTRKRCFEEQEVSFLQAVANVLANAVRNSNTDEVLRESERSLAKAQQIARVGNWQYELMTGQLSGSAEMYRIVGLQPGADLPSFQEFVEQYIHPDDRQKILRSHQATINFFQPTALEFRIVPGKTQPARHVRVDAEIVGDGGGWPLKIIGTLQDISERKQVELALRESEEKFRVLTERSPAIVLIARAGHIVYCNPALSAASGYSLEELQRMPFLEIIHPDYREFVSQQYRRWMSGEKLTTRYEIGVLTKDCQHRWLDLSAQLIEFEGAPAVLVACVDITERKAAEQQIWEMDAQLAHVSRLSMMGEMVAGIAHEINQPLSAIANFAAACRNTIKSGEQQYDAPIMTWLETIDQQAVRCGDIIRQLRSFAKKGDNQRTQVELNAVVIDSIALIGSDVRQRAMIECQFPDSEPMVYANHVQIQQVLVNLLRNACEAASEQPYPEVSVTVSRCDSYARIAVQDNGPGVQESQEHQLFDAFYTTKPSGMGMGLAISKSIMELLDGSLTFEPANPSGAIFVVQIPLSRGESQ